jgi:hypothetical protein
VIVEIRKRLQRVPFIPFLVRMSEDHEYTIPTHDHAFIIPRGNRVIVVDDEGTTNVLGPLHINAIVDQQPNGEI